MGELTKESKQDEGLRRLKDGSLVEGLAPGGKVLIIRNEPSFKRDIIPYFSGSIMIVVAMMMRYANFAQFEIDAMRRSAISLRLLLI